MKNPEAKLCKVFFALWPGQHLRQEIIARRQQLQTGQWRRVPDHNLHLTLLFLGNQAPARIMRLRSAVDGIQARGFDLLLDEFSWFARPQVLCLGGLPPAAGLELMQQLTKFSTAAGMDFNQCPWKPHMTLFRRVRQQPDCAAPQPLHWRVRQFVLLQSIAAQPYRVLQRWPLL